MPLASSTRREPYPDPSTRSAQTVGRFRSVSQSSQEQSISLWNARVGHETRHEARIEAAFDQAEAYAMEGKLERALESLSEAEDLGGGLPDAYLELREWWIASLDPLAVVVRRRPGVER